MWDAWRNEDKRPSRARELLPIKEDDVLALEDVEGFGSVGVDVERRPEVRRLVGLEK